MSATTSAVSATSFMDASFDQTSCMKSLIGAVSSSAAGRLRADCDRRVITNHGATTLTIHEPTITPCPWGCKPDRYLDYREGQLFLLAAEDIGATDEQLAENQRVRDKLMSMSQRERKIPYNFFEAVDRIPDHFFCEVRRQDLPRLREKYQRRSHNMHHV